MNEWIKKLVASIKGLWSKWTIVQKGILAGVVVVVIAAIVLTIGISSKPTTVPVFSTPITDIDTRDNIVRRLEQENVKVYTSSDGIVSVKDEQTARRMRTILITENLLPSKADPYAVFNITNWSKTDFNDKVNWKNSMESLVSRQLESLDGVRSANVLLSLPEDSLFASEQKATTASVTIFANPNSDILEDKKKIKGIQNLVKFAVEGLQDDGIVIVDGNTSLQVNDFTGMDVAERVDQVAKEQKLIQKLEGEYSSRVLKALQGTFTAKRVRVANIKIGMDMSREQSQATIYSPIEIKKDNPDTPYDDSEYRDNLILSSETVTKKWTGTGYNPEGPAGTDGETPPVYSDMSNVVGRMEETGVKQNNVVNKTETQKEVSPTIKTITVGVNIDGKWERQYDEKGRLKLTPQGGIERVYTPLTAEEIASARDLVIMATGSDKEHVTVTNIQFDRSEEFNAEDEAFRREEETRKMIIYILVGVAAVLFVFILFRFITRELERRKRLREEEELRKQQAAREAALWDARNDGVEVTMSVEERKRAELQEGAIAMAKEHPEDVAMLIRTWLMEE